MSIADLRRELTRWTYRPGWKMEITHTTFKDPGPYAGALGLEVGRLHVTYTADDSRNPGRETRIAANFALPFMLLEYPDQFPRWLQETMFEMERHESQEWLRRDGQLFDDPHAKDGKS